MHRASLAGNTKKLVNSDCLRGGKLCAWAAGEGERVLIFHNPPFLLFGFYAMYTSYVFKNKNE